MVIPYLMLIFLFGCVIAMIVFIGFQQSAEWAKLLADQQKVAIQPPSRNGEIAPAWVESFPLKSTAGIAPKP